MGKHTKTLDQIRRLNGGLHWTKVEALLLSWGATIEEKAGSTITFVLDGRKMTFDRPHPRKACGRGLVKKIRKHLRALGRL